MKKYEYNIQPKELDPKIGDNKYYAEVILFRVLKEEKYVTLNPGFPECQGKTESEAETKMHEIVEKWISENS